MTSIGHDPTTCSLEADPARPSAVDRPRRRPDHGRRLDAAEGSRPELRRARRAAPPAAAPRPTSPSSRSKCRSWRAPAPFVLKDNIVPIEISEYAGYAGLIVANGGLEPTENSVFFKNHGFKVKLTISEDESWSAAEPAARSPRRSRRSTCWRSYGRQFHAVVPAQIGYLARRRRPRRPQRDQEDQRSQGQDRRDRRSSPKPTSSSAISRRKPASR